MAVYEYARVTALSDQHERKAFKDIADQITKFEESGWEFVQFVTLSDISMFAVIRRPKQ